MSMIITHLSRIYFSREKENKRKRDAARRLRKRFETGEAEEGDSADVEAASLNEEEAEQEAEDQVCHFLCILPQFP